MTDWSKGAAWMGGEVVPIDEAKIGVTDWGVTRSDITYDVAPVWEGGFFRLDDYIARFCASMAAIRLDVGMDADAIRAACHAIAARSGLRAAYVAMVASRGTPLVHGVRDPRQCRNHFFAWCVPYIHVIRPEIAEQGASVWIAKEVRRIPEDSVNPRAKNYHWGDFTQGLFEAKDRGFETVLLLDHAGNVTEGPGFNAFALKGDRVVTSEHGVLHGITRRTVLEMCDEVGGGHRAAPAAAGRVPRGGRGLAFDHRRRRRAGDQGRRPRLLERCAGACRAPAARALLRVDGPPGDAPGGSLRRLTRAAQGRAAEADGGAPACAHAPDPT